MIPVVEICSRLVAIDTSNYGRAGGKGERAAAAYVAGLLREVAYDPVVLESAPGRANVVVRVPGTDPDLPGLLVHGHLDVVPADAADWTVPPFEGRVSDGYVWGRGASDMKDMVAMMVATLLGWAASGTRPRRDIVFAFVADEEEDGQYGAEWLVAEHPSLFAGVEAAIGEAGGVPTTARRADGSDVRVYPVAVAERGTLHLSVTVRGTAGHGSRPNDDNPVIHLIRGLDRLTRYRWPVEPTPVVQAFISRTATALGISGTGMEEVLDRLGPLRIFADRTLRCSATPTVLDAGYKYNVVPSTARAEIDVRSLPGTEDRMLKVIDELLGDRAERTFLSNNPAIAAPLDSPWYEAIRRSIERSDPDAVVVPYCMSGATDAKPFARLGIAGYGFAPLGHDPDGRFPAGMHGVDERVPVAALETGLRILRDFLTTV
ncbi:M20/M25/M40 family metallo-hydrolase [Actinomadura sp. DC4]|uniref:M20/M25/M40 family metallo-hydrolase n=1 Tax=Actinomadura sp. DC4 TaxID=3055069 RepID=UPI0025AF863F|nr:M20/M25/M40 family metallo-hydrolase [Actinomadura sp. DC4]MDN3353634.1 M20/M25/M40 family metallo-hydrolase [Actinomadura sp. DC4]